MSAPSAEPAWGLEKGGEVANGRSNSNVAVPRGTRYRAPERSPMDLKLGGKRAPVTGSSCGIGAAMARRLTPRDGVRDADLVTYLASPLAEYSVGTIVRIDGGLTP